MRYQKELTVKEGDKKAREYRGALIRKENISVKGWNHINGNVTSCRDKFIVYVKNENGVYMDEGCNNKDRNHYDSLKGAKEGVDIKIWRIENPEKCFPGNKRFAMEPKTERIL